MIIQSVKDETRYRGEDQPSSVQTTFFCCCCEFGKWSRDNGNRSGEKNMEKSKEKTKKAWVTMQEHGTELERHLKKKVGDTCEGLGVVHQKISF